MISETNCFQIFNINTKTNVATSSIINCTTTVDASSSANYISGFTYGEVLTNFFLFIIMTIVVYQFFYFSIKHFKIK